MCHEHNEPRVDMLYLVSIIIYVAAIYSSSAPADVSGLPVDLSVFKSLIRPLFIARLAIFLIMQALFL